MADLAIAVGWALAFAAAFPPGDAPRFAAVAECAIAAAGCFGFGVGWHLRGGGGAR